MCVIMVVDGKADPTATVVRDCWDSNAFGAGIAWRDNGRVHWEKGVFNSDADVYARIMRLPKPYLVHFRIPTVGDTCEELCHPFPLGGDLALYGKTKDGVIAHNGHWNEWQDAMLRFLGRKRYPDGQWSDSRAMAWIGSMSGHTFFSLLEDHQKIALLTPEKLRLYGKWHTIEGIQYSNDHWHWQYGSGRWDGKRWIRDDHRPLWDRAYADADAEDARPINANERAEVEKEMEGFLTHEQARVHRAVSRELADISAENGSIDPWDDDACPSQR